MVEKIGTIKNPLTIIAIFAGLAETSGTAVLPFVEKSIQGTFVWFLIIFPLFLVMLFFLTLNFNHRVLYAPSDFTDEENFMKSFVKSTAQDKVDKINEELLETEEELIKDENNKHELTSEAPDTTTLEFNKSLINKNIQATYLLAEQLVMTKLSLLFKKHIDRELTFDSGSTRYKFDGLIKDGKELTAIEVKYISNAKNFEIYLSGPIMKLEKIYDSFDSDTKIFFKLILAIVTNFDKQTNELIKQRIAMFIYKMNFPIELKIYNLDELKEEMGIGKT
ncbi:MAG: hypothetical protein WC209_16720 [Ignavibacteriaceae bacterium]|jgi:hypothetical protein